jgi:hypothetical protein
MRVVAEIAVETGIPVQALESLSGDWLGTLVDVINTRNK